MFKNNECIGVDSKGVPLLPTIPVYSGSRIAVRRSQTQGSEVGSMRTYNERNELILSAAQLFDITSVVYRLDALHG